MKNIAVIMGGYSSEYGISVKSGNVVYQHLDRNLYRPFRILITPEKWVMLADDTKEFPVNRHDFSVDTPEGKLEFDCVFNAIHGSPGEDGLLQAYFKLLKLPQTSCDYYQAALTFGKRDLLSVLKSYDIPCAKSFFLNKGETWQESEIIDRVGLPCFVKANRAGSSFGVSKVKQASELKDAIEVAFREDDEVLIEEALVGREVSVGVITYKGEVKVLPITEILSENEFFDYEAKYQGKSREVTPAELSVELQKQIEITAEKIYKVLRMKGYTRSEFILKENIPHLLEVNTTPGLTEASILPQQAAACGISLSELFGSAISEALKKNP